MSDFLTNLVARSLGPAPQSLRPKLPSLFEAPAGNEPILEKSAGMEAQEETVELESRSTLVARRPRREERVADKNERHASHRVERRRDAPESDRIARQTILPALPDEPSGPPTESPRGEQVVTARRVGADESLGERKPVEDPRMEAAVRSVEKKEEAESRSKIVSRLAPVIPKLESPQLASQVEDGLDEKLFPAEEQSPTVHIRIGRIEVRAVTQPPAPARPVVPNRPKMTLDEYLLSRNEGRR